MTNYEEQSNSTIEDLNYKFELTLKKYRHVSECKRRKPLKELKPKIIGGKDQRLSFN